MANTVFNIAVISFPRTCSKTLAQHYGKLYNRPVAEGSLHDPEYMASDCFNPSLVFDETHVLHGHWHSLYKLEPDVLAHLREHYKIVTSYRKEELVRESVLKITGYNNAFNNAMDLTIPARKEWDIWKQYVIEGDNIETVKSIPAGYC